MDDLNQSVEMGWHMIFQMAGICGTLNNILKHLRVSFFLFFFDVLSFNNSSNFSDLCLSKEFPTLEFHYLCYSSKNNTILYEAYGGHCTG